MFFGTSYIISSPRNSRHKRSMAAFLRNDQQSRPKIFFNFRSCDPRIGPKSKIWFAIQYLPYYWTFGFKTPWNDGGLTSAPLHDIRFLDFQSWDSETNSWRWKMHFLLKSIGDDRQSQSGIFFYFRSRYPEIRSKIIKLNSISSFIINSVDVNLHRMIQYVRLHDCRISYLNSGSGDQKWNQSSKFWIVISVSFYWMHGFHIL